MERALKAKLPGGKFPSVEPAHRRMMQAVRGNGNSTTEARFKAALVGAGISGWKANCRSITGCPDFFFPHAKLVVFLDGCFWHGCDMCGHVPKRNSQFWSFKIMRNSERDERTTALLRLQGFVVLRFWEHEIVDALQDCLASVQRTLTGKRSRRTNCRKPNK